MTFRSSKLRVLFFDNIEEKKKTFLNPLTAGIFTVFGQFIREQSVTQRSMGREAPRYPPQCPGP